MVSRLLPRPFQARLTTTILPPTRFLSARSARAARLRRRQPTTSSTTTTSSPSSPSHPPPAQPIPNTNTYPSTASPRSSLLDPTDPLNLLGPQRQRRDDPHQPAIHFFEQDVSQIGESAPQPVNLARMAADEARAAELRAKIARLESEIDQIENSDEAELDATLMRLRAVYKDDDDGGVFDVGGGRAKAEGKEGEKGNGEVVELLGDAEPEQVRAELEALRIAGIGSSDKRIKESVGRLNNCLRHAYLATDPQARPVIRQELWKAYKRAKMHAGSAALLERIPPPAWDLLFYSQAVRWKSNEKRDEHVRELLADMKSVGMDGPPTRPPDGKPLEVVD